MNNMNSPPSSVCKALILVLNWFSTWDLKVTKIWSSRFGLKGVYPSVFRVHVKKCYIVLKAIFWKLVWGAHKSDSISSRSFVYMVLELEKGTLWLLPIAQEWQIVVKILFVFEDGILQSCRILLIVERDGWLSDCAIGFV